MWSHDVTGSINIPPLPQCHSGASTRAHEKSLILVEQRGCGQDQKDPKDCKGVGGSGITQLAANFWLKCRSKNGGQVAGKAANETLANAHKLRMFRQTKSWQIPAKNVVLSALAMVQHVCGCSFWAWVWGFEFCDLRFAFEPANLFLPLTMRS